jgi:hypothetical protein
MKNFLENFPNYISGCFSNVIDAGAHSLFFKKQYSAPLDEKKSNNVGRALLTLTLLAFFIYLKFYLL